MMVFKSSAYASEFEAKVFKLLFPFCLDNDCYLGLHTPVKDILRTQTPKKVLYDVEEIHVWWKCHIDFVIFHIPSGGIICCFELLGLGANGRGYRTTRNLLIKKRLFTKWKIRLEIIPANAWKIGMERLRSIVSEQVRGAQLGL